MKDAFLIVATAISCASLSSAVLAQSCGQGSPCNVTINTVGSSAVLGNNTATSGTGTNGGSFYSSSPQGAGVVGENTTGGPAGYFQGPVTATGTVSAPAFNGTNNTVGSSAVSGNNTATSGTGTNGGSFYSSSPQGAGVVGVNATGGPAGYFQGPVTVSGVITTQAITITGGSDLAEPFRTSGTNIPKGAVVVIDEKAPGQLKLADRPYDTRVAGVVSGANNIHPGISMHQGAGDLSDQNVTLSGRVYVLADAANGAIEPGDLLTTSTTRGRAMKVIDHARAHGAIIGKAMSGLSQGQGLVLMLVTLQ